MTTVVSAAENAPERESSRKAYMRAWRAAHKEHLAAVARVYYAENRERLITKSAKWKAANPDKRKAHDAAYRSANRDRLRTDAQAYRAANPDKNREWLKASPEKRKEWLKANRAAINAWPAKHRADKVRATPPWVNHEEIREIYQRAAALGMHVDHIHPLRGKNFCGLHVPWNLQPLAPLDNLRKSNKLLPEYAS